MTYYCSGCGLPYFTAHTPVSRGTVMQAQADHEDGCVAGDGPTEHRISPDWFMIPA